MEGEQKEKATKEVTIVDWTSFADGLIVASIVWAICFVYAINKL